MGPGWLFSLPFPDFLEFHDRTAKEDMGLFLRFFQSLKQDRRYIIEGGDISSPRFLRQYLTPRQIFYLFTTDAIQEQEWRRRPWVKEYLKEYGNPEELLEKRIQYDRNFSAHLLGEVVKAGLAYFIRNESATKKKIKKMVLDHFQKAAYYR